MQATPPARLSAAAAAAPSPGPIPFWWLPYAIGGFMLTPFAVWAGLYLSGIAGPKSGFGTPEMIAMTFASLPLAGLFYVANLGQIASAMRGGPETLTVPPIARLLPWCTGGIGAAGVVVLALLGRDTGGIVAVAAATVAMVVFMQLGLAPSSTSVRRAPRPVRIDSPEPLLWLLLNVFLVLAFVSLAWSPAIIFYAALAGVPLAFILILGVANARDEEPS
ncbi:hypothetical protein [Elioraea sp.]|uniref:hypothetical protein n=1 Tax=Elioraea sp. TaxID=2185103 RepID=UPI0025B82EAC|nr:hypothetical protein [Elioraea sp.]